jgi:hypothetical protein
MQMHNIIISNFWNVWYYLYIYPVTELRKFEVHFGLTFHHCYWYTQLNYLPLYPTDFESLTESHKCG